MVVRLTLVDWVNSDEISFSDLEGIVYDLGYKDKMEMYSKYPGSQAFKEIKSNQEIVEMFDVFRRIRIVNIYICEVLHVALKVLHPGDEEYSDVGEDSSPYKFSEEDEEMVPSEEEVKEMVLIGQEVEEIEKEMTVNDEQEEMATNE